MTTNAFNLSADPMERLKKADPAKTILVDCNGTLFMVDGKPNNMELANRLLNADHNGYTVIIFSQRQDNSKNLRFLDVAVEKQLLGQAREETMQNWRAEDGESLYFGEILEKSDAFTFFKESGARPLLIVDDEHNSHNIDAVNKIGPTDYEAFDKIVPPKQEGPAIGSEPTVKVA
jgi:hypothetical protein